MSVSRNCLEDIVVAAGADTLGLAGALKLGLIAVPFNPSVNMTFEGTDEATFAGSAAKVIAAATRTTAEDPSTGDLMINIPAATGSNVFESTAAPVPPETIHGWYLGTDTLGLGEVKKADLFYDESGTPVTYTISLANQQITVPVINLRLLSEGVV